MGTSGAGEVPVACGTKTETERVDAGRITSANKQHRSYNIVCDTHNVPFMESTLSCLLAPEAMSQLLSVLLAVSWGVPAPDEPEPIADVRCSEKRRRSRMACKLYSGFMTRLSFSYVCMYISIFTPFFQTDTKIHYVSVCIVQLVFLSITKLTIFKQMKTKASSECKPTMGMPPLSAVDPHRDRSVDAISVSCPMPDSAALSSDWADTLRSRQSGGVCRQINI